MPGGGEEEEVEERRLPNDFRQKVIAEYRQRQRARLETSAQPRAAAPAPGGPPPQPPSPPPANNWVPIGPSVARKGQASNRPAVSGRIDGIAIGSGGSRVYAASANGGVWRSDDGGLTWRSMMDAWDLDPTTQAADSLACGAIAIDPTNPDRVYVGTGEPFGAIDSYLGVGPLLSPDGGVNWTTEPTASGSPGLAGRGFYRLAVDPGDPDRVVGATTNGLYRREPDGSGGFQWARKQTGAFSSVVVARVGGTTTFYAARKAGGIFRSTDGNTWNPFGTGFPSTNVGVVGLAVQPNNPDVIYALIENNGTDHLLGVWRLDATDNTWRPVSGAPTDLFGPDPSQPGQGWYDLAVAVDPNNVNRLYLGGSTKVSGGQWSGSLYRSIVTSSGSGSGLTYSMTNTFIGGTVHADIHALEFTPGNSDRLWVGCDGGIFFTEAATGAATFEARNVGLATLTMNHLGMHPTEDAVLFCGAQDNGTIRYTGEEACLHSAAGDGGFVVVNWNDPYRVVRTYVLGIMERAIDGGQGYASWNDVSLPSPHYNNALFYAPLAGTPRNPGAPAEADILAFGGRRVWISTTFGTSWQSIPNNSAADDLPGGDFVLSLAFASATRLYVGTRFAGTVYRFDKSGATWSRTTISAAPLLAGPITDIAVDLADATGNSIYVTLGGSGDYRHVWHFDGTSWQQRSGPAAGSASSLLDVQHNAVVVDPSHTSHLYAGADIGIWRSTDSGGTWSPFSEGLPDAAVIDVNMHNGRRLLWAATHGRGIYERKLDTTTALGVELYLRDTQLDRGRYPTVDWLNDPEQPGQTVAHWRGPGIKVDVPSSMGTYQTPTDQINFFQFVDTIVDGSGGVATVDPMVGVAHNRVYVEVHNRGVTPADNVRVMLLLANASAGLPNLPAGYQANVQAGTPISTADWHTVGFQILNDLRVGFPKIASFDLPSTMLPPPTGLPGNAHQCLLALLHSSADPFTATETHVDTLSPAERKAAHKNLHVVQFTGTLPPGPAPAQWVAIRLHGLPKKHLLSDLTLDLGGYAGRVGLMIPHDLGLRDGLEKSLGGFRVEKAQGYDAWAKRKRRELALCLRKKLFDPLWCNQMDEAIRKLRGQPLLVVAKSRVPATLRRFLVPRGAFYTVFLAIERPGKARVGQAFEFSFFQRDSETQRTLGGSTYRVEIVPAAKR